jgi:hypothetical protein
MDKQKEEKEVEKTQFETCSACKRSTARTYSSRHYKKGKLCWDCKIDYDDDGADI